MPCSSSGALGCPVDAQLWAPGNASAGWPLLSALSYGGGTPFPGPYLTDSGVPGGLYAQPALNGTLRGVSQSWVTAIPGGGGSVANTTLRGAGGDCLAPAPLTPSNVWVRWLANGDVALLMINFGGSAAAVSCDAACMAAVAQPRPGPPPTQWLARDVWLHAPVGTISQAAGYTTPILPAAGGSMLLRLTPATN